MALPPKIEEHVNDFIARTDWPKITVAIGDPCAGCPGRGWVDTHPEDRDQPPCFQCPLWSLRVDLTMLRLRQKLEGLDTGQQ